MNMRLCAPAALTLLLGWSASASAIPVNCPGTVQTTDREFTLDTTPTAVCQAFGTGNLNGDNDVINQAGWTTLDKSDDNTTGLFDGWLTITGSGTSSGTFTINPLAWANYGSLAIGFKAGEGQLDPDWAVFTLLANAVTGTWSISGSQTLSHANLYGMGTPPPPSVPEPTSMLLLGTGLVGLASRVRRRN
jgi:hypothetical protein